ncbi:MAG: hypothetical protein H3C54_06715 [Taibaiella sp.]|nr:hypothetical protein [Taibaiella sp.]
MKWYKIIMLATTLTLISCNPNQTGNKQSAENEVLLTPTNKIAYSNRRENLKLSVTDTIRKSISYFFSNPRLKDSLVLTIEPGMVKNSKAKLEIITAGNNVIYTQNFEAFYFIKWIYEPDSIPTTGGQDAYERYLENYWRSITPEQYEAYFRKSVEHFFDDIYPIEENKHNNIKVLEKNISDE